MRLSGRWAAMHGPERVAMRRPAIRCPANASHRPVRDGRLATKRKGNVRKHPCRDCGKRRAGLPGLGRRHASAATISDAISPVSGGGVSPERVAGGISPGTAPNSTESPYVIYCSMAQHICMDAIIQPGLVAPMAMMARDLGCTRMSFVAQDERLTALAATPDKSVLLHGFVPAKVLEAGGFSLEERNLNLMMSPSMAKAHVSYDGVEMAQLSYGRRNSSSWASPFTGRRHPAKNLPAEHDARALIQTQKLIDSIYQDYDAKPVGIQAAGDRLVVNGVDVGGARGEAAGRYAWTPLACMLNGCQHAEFTGVWLKDGGPLLLLCTEEIDLKMCVAHL